MSFGAARREIRRLRKGWRGGELDARRHLTPKDEYEAGEQV